MVMKIILNENEIIMKNDNNDNKMINENEWKY